ncbi:MAG TPA: glutathione S-transferase family protein [Terricaulis sp.]|nr:glutathione S-transferase family protein [Terricaulis sp.]HRP12220.1 glutathione S-transferase family protein [Terricaulis sp.]
MLKLLDASDAIAAAADRGGAGGGYVLYGAYASYYTGKTRAYLRKKGIPFVERLPSHPRFREVVSPTAQSKRIPILETPDGYAIQDSTTIFEFLEARFPDPPALPPGPRQRLAAYLVDLFASEGLNIAWHFRWNFKAINAHFVMREFGRSFAPRGDDETLDRYGQIIADRMDGYRARHGIQPEMFPALEAIYYDWLDVLEQHFTNSPFLFGGLPSVGDFALMGPLFAHLGRDPYPLQLMQLRAPRVFRWIEHMNTPEIVSPEFHDEPTAYLPGDAIPETTSAFLRGLAADYAPVYLATAALFGDWCARNANAPRGMPVSPEGKDQPVLGPITIPLRGHQLTTQAPLHSLWVLQRTLDWLATLAPAERAACDAYAREIGAGDLISIKLPRPLTRVNNKLAVN